MLFTAAVLLLGGCARAAGGRAQRLTATRYDSGFALAHDTFNGISTASDGRIYYVLSSESIDTGAQMYSFDPASKHIEHLADLTEASGEKGLHAIPQGKSHVGFVESNGKLYFATHLGYYNVVGGVEQAGVPPAGYKPYPGGHLLVYDLKSKKIEELGTAPHREGIIAMNMDTTRGILYGLTWPTGYFFRYDLATRQMKSISAVAKEGERGKGETYETICRSLAVDPRDGSVYLTTSPGAILRYRPDTGALEPVARESMVKDYFGKYDASRPGHMGYNWRQTAWDARAGVFYGVHGNSGYLFRFDPRVPRIDVLDRITSEPSRRSGMFDQFNYGYLGFTLAPDGHTIHYVTGGPSGTHTEDLHLVTYDVDSNRYRDHGPIFFGDGERLTKVNSIAVGRDGTVYALARVADNDKARTDLISIASPLQK